MAVILFYNDMTTIVNNSWNKNISGKAYHEMPSVCYHKNVLRDNESI